MVNSWVKLPQLLDKNLPNYMICPVTFAQHFLQCNNFVLDSRILIAEELAYNVIGHNLMENLPFIFAVDIILSK